MFVLYFTINENTYIEYIHTTITPTGSIERNDMGIVFVISWKYPDINVIF